MEKNIAVIKGDGIGPEIVTEAMKVLDAVAKKYNHKFNYTEILMGGCSIDAYGVPLSDEALKIAKKSDSVLLGAIGGNTTTSPWYKLEPSLRPEAGLLKIRKELGLFANLRPAYLYDELKGACPLKEELTAGGFDMMIMRELTGGLYFGERSTEKEGDQMVARDSMSYSESEIRRIAKRGFDIAMKRNKKVIRIILIIAAIAAALAGSGYALWKTGVFERINSVEELREVISGAGAWAGVVYFFLQMMTVIVAPIPSNISMMAGALALGFWPAMILGVLAVGVGSVIVFLAARALGRNAIHRFLDKGVMEKYLPVIEEKQDMFLFLTMLFPFFPDDALCMLAGLTNIPLGRFVVIMALSRPWGLIVAALMGSGSISLPIWAWAVIGVAGLFIFYFAMKYSAQIEEALLRFVRKIVPKKTKIDRK